MPKIGVFYNCTVSCVIGPLQSSGSQGTWATVVNVSGIARSFRITEQSNMIDVKGLSSQYEQSLALTDTGTIDMELMYDLDTGNGSPVFNGSRGKFVKVTVAFAETGTPNTVTYIGVVQQTGLGAEVDGMITESVQIKLGCAYVTGFGA